MGIDRLNRWLTLLANLGVLAGLIVLVLEIQQNRDLAAASLRNDISRRVVETNRTSASETFGPTLFKNETGEALTPYEAFVHQTFLTAALEISENIYYQHQAGLFGSDDEIRSVGAQLVFRMDNPRNYAVYQRYKPMLTSEFVDFVDNLIADQWLSITVTKLGC